MDSTAILTTIITALVTIFTVILNSRSTENKIMGEMKINQAVTEEKIRTLTSEVQRHNNFAEKIPRIEEKVDALSARIQKLEEK